MPLEPPIELVELSYAMHMAMTTLVEEVQRVEFGDVIRVWTRDFMRRVVAREVSVLERAGNCPLSLCPW